MKLNKFLVLFTTLCLILAHSAFAGRFGGGRSYGMQRSYAKPNYINRSYNQQPHYAQPQPAQITPQKRPGMGAGTAAALGAAAGAAGGYMLGRSMSDNGNMATDNRVAASNVQAASPVNAPASEDKLPWGTIGILVALLLLGLLLFKRKAAAGFLNNDQSNPPFNNGNTAKFDIPQVNRQQMSTPASAYSPFGRQSQANQQFEQANIDKMPDGIETVYFLRQVKGMFLHIQSMNNSDNIGEIEKYMTPQLYLEMKQAILENNVVADFTDLDCQLLNCELDNNQLVASVKFFGKVSEAPNVPPMAFAEVWNFVKSDLSNGKWLVAGIQQEPLQQ